MSQHNLVEALEADDNEAIRAAISLPSNPASDQLVEYTKGVFNLGVAIVDKMTPAVIESSAKHTVICAGFLLLLPLQGAEAEDMEPFDAFENICQQCSECGCMR